MRNCHELVERCQAGDREAIPLLFEAVQDDVYRLIRSRLGDSTDAEDATQETFVQILSSLATLRDPKAFAGREVVAIFHSNPKPSDELGRFVFPEEEQDAKYMAAWAPGYEFDIAQLADQDWSKIRMSLHPATDVLKGFVHDFDGKPVEGAKVVVMQETMEFDGHKAVLLTKAGDSPAHPPDVPLDAILLFASVFSKDPPPMATTSGDGIYGIDRIALGHGRGVHIGIIARGFAWRELDVTSPDWLDLKLEREPPK